MEGVYSRYAAGVMGTDIDQATIAAFGDRVLLHVVGLHLTWLRLQEVTPILDVEAPARVTQIFAAYSTAICRIVLILYLARTCHHRQDFLMILAP